VTCGGGTASFATPGVGTAKTVTVSGLALNGNDAGNYTLTSSTATTTADITAATVTATVTAAGKTYDGTVNTTATCLVGAGVISPDVVSCATGAASFDSKLVGTGKTVTVSGLTLGGTDAGNYTLASSTATTTASITTATLTPTVTAASKTYDGTGATTATGVCRAVTARCSSSHRILTDRGPKASFTASKEVRTDRSPGVE